MVDIVTGATSAAGAGQLANQVLTVYDRSAFFALRDAAVFVNFPTVKPGTVTSPGNPVTFRFWNEMSVDTTPLDEIADVEAVGLGDTSVTVTPKEYGKAVLKTIRIRVDDYLLGFDADVANLLNQSMIETLELIARDAYDAATNVESMNQTTESSIVATDVLTANKVRERHANLRSAKVQALAGTLYVALISPDVAYDLKKETGDAGWLVPHAYVDTQNIYANELGTFGGFRFIETPRVKLNTDGGSSAVDTYSTYFLGQEAVAKAETIPVRMVAGPITDKLMRLQPLGWYTYQGWGMFRQASLRRVLSASSIGANS